MPSVIYYDVCSITLQCQDILIADKVLYRAHFWQHSYPSSNNYLYIRVGVGLETAVDRKTYASLET